MTSSSGNLNEFVAYAQIASTLITLIGIIVTMWMSIKAIKEVRVDRRIRQKPFLAFESGGFRLPIEFKRAGRAIPGINPAALIKLFPNLPETAESVRIKDFKNEDGSMKPSFYGKLRNYGQGPALLVSVTWVPKIIWIGSEQFEVNDKKLSEPLYSKDLNEMPASPSHILPGDTAEITRLPSFIDKDFEKKITQVDGVFSIECKDIFGERYQFTQEFYLFTGYKESSPYVHVTFSNVI